MTVGEIERMSARELFGWMSIEAGRADEQHAQGQRNKAEALLRGR